MALTINGTTGISGVDGSASAPVFTGNDSNTGLSFGTDIVNVNTGGTTRLSVDASGRIGVGTTSPDKPFEIRTETASHEIFAINRVGSNTAALYMGNDSSSNAIIAANNADIKFGRDFNGTFTERARLTNLGRLLIGTTSTFDSVSSAFLQIDGGGAAGIAVTGSSTGGQSRVSFFNPNGRVGFINTSGSSTGYNTSSDYRLKENAVAISDGITRLKTLKPYRFNWKSDASTTVDGFFAHEVTAVPEAVTGEKDGEEMQAIDQSKLVPLLTAALQEAVGKIETLETKVAALEAA